MSIVLSSGLGRCSISNHYKANSQERFLSGGLRLLGRSTNSDGPTEVSQSYSIKEALFNEFMEENCRYSSPTDRMIVISQCAYHTHLQRYYGLPNLDIPISNQWDSAGYPYPIQIAQFGLKYYGHYLTLANLGDNAPRATKQTVVDIKRIFAKKLQCNDDETECSFGEMVDM